MRSCRQPPAVTVFSEWYFLTVNRPPFSPAPSDANCTSTIRPSREPAGHGRNRHHEPSGISGSIDVAVTRATNMPGFTATPGTSVQLLFPARFFGSQIPASAASSVCRHRHFPFSRDRHLVVSLEQQAMRLPLLPSFGRDPQSPSGSRGPGCQLAR